MRLAGWPQDDRFGVQKHLTFCEQSLSLTWILGCCKFDRHTLRQRQSNILRALPRYAQDLPRT